MQKLLQEQSLRQEQQQRISQLYHLYVRLLSLTTEEMEQRITEELETNPALEKDYEQEPAEGNDNLENVDNLDNLDNSDNLDTPEKEDLSDELQQALQNLDDSHYDDPHPHYDDPDRETPEERANRTQTSEQTFLDSMRDQMLGLDLTPEERQVMEYLIGSLDDSGFLTDNISDIADELEIYHNLPVTPTFIEETLKKIQTFDPAGVGARNMQECLLLQIDRKKPSEMKELMRRVIENHFADFMNLRWNNISNRLKIDKSTTETLRQELRKLNPTPGSAPNETKRNLGKTIIPDYIVHVDQEQNITFTLNDRNTPLLLIDKDFQTEADNLKERGKKLNKYEMEALNFSRHYIYQASLFIDAADKRKKTLLAVMNAIIRRQRSYFLTGDEAELRPMTVADIAEELKIDPSTVSRVRKNRYLQTDWGLTALESLFSEQFKPSEAATEISTNNVKQIIASLISAEEKDSPLTDDEIAKQLKSQGLPIARRTVAKYREQMGIPVARIRKNDNH